MATAHNVNQMSPEDGKFKFRLKGANGMADRIVWGYIPVPTRQLPVVKLDGEHTYLWINDSRIDQVILEFEAGGSYDERVAAHADSQFKLFGCQASRDGEVCLYGKCPLTGGKPGRIPSGTGPCPHDRSTGQENLDLEDGA